MNVTLDLRCGVSGDMLLGALLQWYSRDNDNEEFLGILEEAASVMHPTRIGYSETDRNGKAARIEVEWENGEDHVTGEEMSRYLSEAVKISGIKRTGRRISEKILGRILEAESLVHLVMDPGEVHLHEAGTPDTIVDALGIGMLYERLELDGAWVQATPISLGYGEVATAHGTLQVPVPAVRSMIRGIPVRGGPVPGELATPTGVAAAVVMTEIWLDQGSGGDLAVLPGKIAGSGAGRREYSPPFRNALDIYLEE
jgi:pyridinium-3,5-bisthiocarboxylic acid mononucleotide nickel chelatase